MFAVDGAFIITSQELPDISIQKDAEFNLKGHTSNFICENMTSGNSEVAFFVRDVEDRALESRSPLTTSTCLQNSLSQDTTSPFSLEWDVC